MRGKQEVEKVLDIESQLPMKHLAGAVMRLGVLQFGVVLSRALCSSFTEKSIPSVIISHRYKAQDTPARKTFEQALTGAFMSAVIKDLRPSALPFVASLIRHYTMVAVAQQCGESGALESPAVPHPWRGQCRQAESPLGYGGKSLSPMAFAAT